MDVGRSPHFFKRCALSGSRRAILGGTILALLGGCRRHQHLPPHRPVGPATNPTAVRVGGPTTQAAENWFDDAGIRVRYPTGWQPEAAATAVLDVAAPPPGNAGGCPGYASLSLDVPSLPPHFPGMITERLVARGYVSDLKSKQMPDAAVQGVDEIAVPRAGAAPGGSSAWAIAASAPQRTPPS